MAIRGATLLLAAFGCRRTPEALPPVVALLTIDTWRADRFDAVHTPNLWALAARGERYTGARSPIGLTSPAHASMLTGLLPWEHQMEGNNHHGYSLAAEVPRVTDRFAGSARAAFVSAWPAGPAGGLDRGFDVFSGPESGERPGEVSVGEALAWLPADRPAFLWVHVYEPHGPYHGSASTEGGRYDEEVARADAILAPLLDALVARGARIVVAGDHGEILEEEKCAWQHERSAADQVLRVPLFRWSPDTTPVVIDGIVGLTDVPALLEGRAIAPRPVWLGESGTCEPGCNGCAPAGLGGRDRVATGEAGRWVVRPGKGKWREGAPDPAWEALLDGIPAVPEPAGEGAEEEARGLGYVE